MPAICDRHGRKMERVSDLSSARGYRWVCPDCRRERHAAVTSTDPRGVRR